MLLRFINRFLTQPFYVLIILILVGTGALFFQSNAQLEPQINADFFFSKKSKIYQQNQKIGSRFILSDSIMIAIPHTNLRDDQYIKLIRELSEDLKLIKGVISVQSMTHGPPSIDSAIGNPLWSRLLDTRKKNSSTIICFIDLNYVASIVKTIESLKIQTQKKANYKIHISGVPYIIEKMRIMLSHDMKNFLAGAVIVSSLFLLFMFSSVFVTIGCLLSALFASCMALLFQQYLGISMGVLTANLGAIVYVLTTSHIVFLTSNWRNDPHDDLNQRIASTITTTLPASFWAMLTTLFGFLSLVMVEAEPLRQLGVGGSLGTIIAFFSSYLVFPIFLRFSKVKKKKVVEKEKYYLPLPFWLGIPIAFTVLLVSLYFGYTEFVKLNTDPSLLTYFKPNQAIYTGLLKVDQLGGSNPLNFVVSQKNKTLLTNSQSYESLKSLHEDIESHPVVGSALSLYVFMEETQKHWLARWLPWGTVISVLSKDQYSKVARGFISEDFKQGLFVIRMKESVGVTDRSKMINQLMAKPKKHGFNLDLVGGSYYMQSELSKNIVSSLKTGVSYLIILFCGIIFLLSFSLSSTLFASLSLVSLVGAMIGVIGYFKIPVDIISSPTLNICLGIAVDGMIHLIMDVKRQSEGRLKRIRKKAWSIALKRQAQPALISSLVVASGFSVFALSEFPPSQRFGLEIVFGSIVAMILTLLVLPQMAYLLAQKNKDT